MAFADKLLEWSDRLRKRAERNRIPEWVERGGTMEVQVYKDKGGEWRWRKVAANGRIVSESGEGYTRYADALEAAEKFADGEIITGPDETYRHPVKRDE